MKRTAVLLVTALASCFIFQPSDAEMNLKGSQAFNEIKSQMPIDRGARVNAYVNCIANAILQVAEDDTGVDRWEVVVFRTDVVNAFAIPGGKIGVFTGLLNVARTPDQLAAVMGHEVAHVLERHSAKQQGQAGLMDTVVKGIAVATKDNQYSAEIAQASEIGAKYGLMLPYGRGQESEADLVGLTLMAKAGFDPRGAVELWQNMQAASGQQASLLTQFSSTHPTNETRIDDLNDAMPDAFLYYQQAQAEGRKPNCRP